MKKLNWLLASIMMVAILSACKQDAKVEESESKPEKADTYLQIKGMYEQSKTKESARAFINAIQRKAASTEDSLEIRGYYNEGLMVAEKHQLGTEAIAFLMPLLKDYSNDTIKEDYIAKLGSALADLGKTIPANIMISAYEDKYPNGRYDVILSKKKTEDIENPKAYIQLLAEKIFENPDQYGINTANAHKYVDACEAYALVYPESDQTPEFLYRAGEMARTIKTFTKALNIYDWLEEKYPNYEKTPTTVFLKGFMLENTLNEPEQAKEVYQRFVDNYPDHALVPDVQFLLENIGKSDEEIMQIIEEKNKK